MSFESETSFAAFDDFATAATLDGEELTSGAIIDRNVEVVDQSGEIRRVQALVHMKKAEADGWSPNDLIDHEAGKFRLQELFADDGVILEISATPAPSA